MTNSIYQIDNERKHLWDACEGVVYKIFAENENYITISRNNKVGLFEKKKNRIIIPAIYDGIGGNHPGSIPDAHFNYTPKPIEVFLDNCVGLVAPDGKLVIDVVVDAEKIVLLPATYGEGFVGAYNADEMTMYPKLCFINSKGCQVTGFIYDYIQSPMRNGIASVILGDQIIKLNEKLEVIDSYPRYFYGFNDECYTLY